MTAPMVQPQPLPTQWHWSAVQGSGGQGAVVVQIHDPSGVKVSFLDPDTAEQVGNGLLAMAKQARTGLVVASPGEVSAVRAMVGDAMKAQGLGARY